MKSQSQDVSFFCPYYGAFVFRPHFSVVPNSFYGWRTDEHGFEGFVSNLRHLYISLERVHLPTVSIPDDFHIQQAQQICVGLFDLIIAFLGQQNRASISLPIVVDSPPGITRPETSLRSRKLLAYATLPLIFDSFIAFFRTSTCSE